LWRYEEIRYKNAFKSSERRSGKSATSVPYKYLHRQRLTHLARVWEFNKNCCASKTWAWNWLCGWSSF